MTELERLRQDAAAYRKTAEDYAERIRRLEAAREHLLLPVAIGIPTVVYREGLEGLCRSIHEQRGVRPDLTLVVNGPAVKTTAEKWNAWGAKGIAPGRNLGVAASWNVLARSAFAAGFPFIVILNDDVVFENDSVLLFFAAAHAQAPDAIWTLPEKGWHAFLLPKTAFEKLGPFDEGFEIAYCEDNDYEYRALLVGVRVLELPAAVKHHWATSARWGGDAAFEKQVKNAKAKNEERYVQKWGSGPRNEKYTTPFNKGKE